MKETLKVINQMVKRGVIERYAIGGAIAAIYYLEPFETSDLDVFVQINIEGSAMAILAPIYEYLRASGYKAQAEFINIEGVPVQFLPSYSPLIDEAIEKAEPVKFERVQTRVVRPEHLVAIMIDTGRPKDYLRINMFLEQGAVKISKLKPVLKRHDLLEKWETNAHRFTI
jgi:hypothetical protein